MGSVDLKLPSCLTDAHISTGNSTWLSENLEGVDQSVKQMLKLLVEEGSSPGENDKSYCKKKPELIAHLEQFYRMHQALAARYDHLTEMLAKNPTYLHRVDLPDNYDSGFHQSSPLPTPNNKLGLQKSEQAVDFDLILSSGGGSTDISLKGGSNSLTSSFSDSDSESIFSIHKFSNPAASSRNDDPNPKCVELASEIAVTKEMVQVTGQDDLDDTCGVKESEGYNQLLGKVIKYEEELRVLNQRFHCSEEEIARLKSEQFENNETYNLSVRTMQVQLESARREIKVRGDDLEIEKRKVVELQKHVAELETQLVESDGKIRMLEEELRLTGESLSSELEIAKLGELKLAAEQNQVLVLQEKISRHIADIVDRDHENKELRAALHDAQENFSLEKAKLQSDICGFQQQQEVLEARIRAWESRTKSLDNEVRQCKAEMLEMMGMHEGQKISWQDNTKQLKLEIYEKGKLVEALEKDLDMLKLKYDMLMAEKDAMNAEVQTLSAELCSRDNQIRQMEDQLHESNVKNVELIAGSENSQKLADDLGLRIQELENEVQIQRIVILDRGEEKREAIRQLCFSLEHYRNRYKELRQAFVPHKRHPVLASQV